MSSLAPLVATVEVLAVLFTNAPVAVLHSQLLHRPALVLAEFCLLVPPCRRVLPLASESRLSLPQQLACPSG